MATVRAWRHSPAVGSPPCISFGLSAKTCSASSPKLRPIRAPARHFPGDTCTCTVYPSIRVDLSSMSTVTPALWHCSFAYSFEL